MDAVGIMSWESGLRGGKTQRSFSLLHTHTKLLGDGGRREGVFRCWGRRGDHFALGRVETKERGPPPPFLHHTPLKQDRQVSLDSQSSSTRGHHRGEIKGDIINT